MRNKKVIFMSGIAVVVTFTVIFIFGFNEKKYQLNYKTMNLEYGEKLNNDINYYITVDKSNLDLLENIKLDVSDITLEDGKDYPKVGNYELEIIVDDEKETVEIIVADSNSPQFKEESIKELNFVKDCEPSAEELSRGILVSDLSNYVIKVDDTQVDYSSVGEYKANVIATDVYNNVNSMEISIKISEPTIELNTKNETLYINKTLALKADIKGKDKNVIYATSDKTIATVDKDGKVTAKKEGKVVITAKANGVEDTCNITVKKKNTTNNNIVSNNTQKEETSNIVVQDKLNGTLKDFINSAKKYVGKSLWCTELIDYAFEDSKCDPYRFELVNVGFMGIREGDIVEYRNHIFIALGSPKKETHSEISFKEEANMQELYLIEGGVMYSDVNKPVVEMNYGFFGTDGYRFVPGDHEDCILRRVYRFR